MDDSIRKRYLEQGVEGYYRQHGANYRNPHEAALRTALSIFVPQQPFDLSHVLDLACGSGEVTLWLRTIGVHNVTGIDPYTHQAYYERTRLTASRLTFEQIATGAISTKTYSLIICSYALHLVAQSRLPTVCYQLARSADHLLLLMPHKRPNIRADWGWRLRNEQVIERVRCRAYQSTLRETI